MNPRQYSVFAALLALTAIAATASAAPEFLDLRRIAPIHGAAAAGQAKATVCIGCHGPSGTSPVPAFPNLAGQKPDYLYWELFDYRRGAHPESPMSAQAAKLSDADLRDLAAYYASLPRSAAASPVDTALAGRGAAIFSDGDPAKGVPPCQGCHGADAGGHPLAARSDARRHPQYLAYPALRGQHADYLVARLRDFRDGKRIDTSNDLIMQGVAHGLDDDTMRAIAAWLSGLPPL